MKLEWIKSKGGDLWTCNVKKKRNKKERCNLCGRRELKNKGKLILWTDDTGKFHYRAYCCSKCLPFIREN